MCWSDQDWGDLVNGDAERDLGTHGKVVRCGGATNNVKRETSFRAPEGVRGSEKADARAAEAAPCDQAREPGAIVRESRTEPGTEAA